jgi:hypothetical protein
MTPVAEVASMTISREGKAKLVTEAIKEDRAELRLIRDRIYSVTILVSAASFGITSFLFTKQDGARIVATFQAKLLTSLIDVALLLILWVLCLLLLTDMKHGQRWMEARQRLLDKLISGTSLKSSIQIYDILPEGQPGITHNNLYWVFGAATAAIAIKLLALWIVFFTEVP